MPSQSYFYKGWLSRGPDFQAQAGGKVTKNNQGLRWPEAPRQLSLLCVEGGQSSESVGCGLAETEEPWVKMEIMLPGEMEAERELCLQPRGLPGDLEWRRALDGAGQQNSGVLPDGM